MRLSKPLTAIFPRAACEPPHNNRCGPLLYNVVCCEVTYKVVAYVLPFKVLCFLDDLGSSKVYKKLKRRAVFLNAMKEYGISV